MPTPPSPLRRAVPWGIVVGIILVALSMRGPIVAPSPVMSDVRADLGLSSAAAGLLTSLPVLMFAVATPLATRIIGRRGPEAAVLVCLLGVLLGTVVRSSGPAPVAILGTVLIGAGIAVGNIVMPVIIRRDVPWQRAATVTGAYTAALNIGAMITSLGTAPLAGLIGWRWALAAWGLLALAAAVVWVAVTRRRAAAAVEAGADAEAPDNGDAPADRDAAAIGDNQTVADGDAPADDDTSRAAPTPAAEPEPSPLRRRIGLLLMLAFCGQSFSYYAVATWLPTLLSDTRGLDPASSGATASLFQLAAVIGSFGVPALAARTNQSVPMALMGALWIATPIGLLVAPEAFVTWSIIGGIAQGGGFTAILSVIARVTRTDTEAASMSARVQFGGYLAATCGPPLAGALNALTGGWVWPLLVILLATAIFTTSGVVAALLSRRARHIPGT